MTYRKWLIATLLLTLTFAVLTVIVNMVVDHHAVRLSLFSGKKEIRRTVYPDGINQHIFNPEYVFRRPDEFDSFLFGSSRTSQIDVAKISAGKFYNMSYSLGIPAQHLAIVKAFLKKGIKIKFIVVGLDDFCFNLARPDCEGTLIRIMHPEAEGPGRLKIFFSYFFRKPERLELSRWKNRVLKGDMKGAFTLNSEGLVLGWSDKDRFIEQTGKPVFEYKTSKYKPFVYNRKKLYDALVVIEELTLLARDHNFKLIFFINPFYEQIYINNAEPLFRVKERLAKLTDYYDFSGFNTITTNPLNYYEESHYRFRVGDMIIDRIFGDGKNTPDGFGFLVTAQNVESHLKKQKNELEKYLEKYGLQ